MLSEGKTSDASSSTPERLKKPMIGKNGRDWKHIREQYETTDISGREHCKLLGISYSTYSHRCIRDKWKKAPNLVALATQQVAATFDEKFSQAVTERAARVAETAAERLVDRLQPWIEKQKREQIKRAIKRSKRAHKRLDTVSKGYQVVTKDGDIVEVEPGPKEEAFIANAEDKYDTIIRRNLGMSDSSGPGGSLSLRILAGQAAVQLVSPASA